MNTSLYKQMLKVNMQGIMSYALGSAFYILLMFWLYPSIASNSEDINRLMESMPEGLGRAFGLQGGFGSAGSFISGEYYGLILILILSIFCITMSTRLMARLVDQGSMAYILAAPTTRIKVALTQAGVLVTGLLVIMGITTAAGLVGNAMFLEGKHSLEIPEFLLMNLSAFLLFIAVGGISFLISAVSSDEKKALGWSGALIITFFVLDLLGKISDNIEWMRYLSIFSLYRPGEIVNGGGEVVLHATILVLIGGISFVTGVQLFRRRDLLL